MPALNTGHGGIDMTEATARQIVLANLVRLVIAAGGGWLALRWSADVSYVFAALGAALAAFGLITAGAVATGAWFGPIVRPRPRVLARARSMRMMGRFLEDFAVGQTF